MPARRVLARCARSTLAVPLGAAALLLLAPTPASAEPVDETVRVPVRLERPDGTRLERAVVLDLVHDRAATKAPFVVLLHGRPESPAGLPAIGEQKYPTNARYLAGLGFVVMIPTRIGYGVTGGPDVEYTGGCLDKHFTQGVAPVVREVAQILEFARTLPYVDAHRGIVMGESFGGLAAIAVAASPLPGVRGAISVSGGDGGALGHLEEPCRPDQLAEAFTAYGRSNRVPTLWMYSRNDRFWGSRYPQAWFDAFSGAGGRGELVWLPADKSNGHYIFNRNAPAWHPAFERFLDAIGLRARPPPGSPQ